MSEFTFRNELTAPEFTHLLTHLEECSRQQRDEADAWPAEQLKAMSDYGVMTWDVPEGLGGSGFSNLDLLEGLRQLSSACLLSTFVLTQRNAAVRRIITSDNLELRDRLLPDLRDGRSFATVAISHLTTSGKHLKQPLVVAVPDGDGFRLNGVAPWATGATQAESLVTGGSLDDGRELLFCLPTNREGVFVEQPVSLLGLNASQTGAVRLNDVSISRQEVLHGPVAGVMNQGSGGGAGSLGTTALALGMTQGVLRKLSLEAQRREDLNEFLVPLQTECMDLSERFRQTASRSNGLTDEQFLRTAANSLVLRSAQTWLAATKGAGYVSGHPAERAVRESLFFLVWSCPQPVLAANLRDLSCRSRHV
ncbi:MAG: acyl-CoA dehydrogenase family protein [Planctomycetaceae bacterium]